MSVGVSRRVVVVGGVAVATGAIALQSRLGVPTVSRRSGIAADAPLADGYRRLRSDLADNWFSTGGTVATGYRAGIVPTNGSGGYDTGTTNNVRSVTGGALWQTAIYAMFLIGDHGHPLGGSDTSSRIRQHLDLLKTSYAQSDASRGLGSDGSGDGTINVSDDAAWKMQMLEGYHRVTGDPSLVTDLTNAIIAINAHYADGFGEGASRVPNGRLPFSRFGMLYARPEQDPNGQGRATTYEVGTMLASLYVYGLTGERAFLAYPATVYQSFKATLQRPSGIYYQTLQLDPLGRHDGTSFHHPIDANPGDAVVPVQGYTGLTIGGTVGMALLAARLYRATREDRYRRDAVQICQGIVTDYLQNGRIVCDRDPWTAGFYFLPFAREVLSLPGIDADKIVAQALVQSGRQILTTRRRISGLTNGWGYSAEWSGNTAPTIAGGFSTWEAHGAAANGGRGGGQAGLQQIMTQASSGMVVQAAALLAA
jgi:hypothetical protein